MDGWQSRAIPDDPQPGTDWRSRATPDTGISLDAPPPSETSAPASSWRNRAIADTETPKPDAPVEAAPLSPPTPAQATAAPPVLSAQENPPPEKLSLGEALVGTAQQIGEGVYNVIKPVGQGLYGERRPTNEDALNIALLAAGRSPAGRIAPSKTPLAEGMFSGENPAGTRALPPPEGMPPEAVAPPPPSPDAPFSPSAPQNPDNFVPFPEGLNQAPPRSPNRTDLAAMLDSDKTAEEIAAQQHADSLGQMAQTGQTIIQNAPPPPAPIVLPEVKVSPLDAQIAQLTAPGLLNVINTSKNRRMIDAATAEYQKRFPHHAEGDFKANEIEQAAQAVDTRPTPAQIDAGNFQKGHFRLEGLDVSIENPLGTTRQGTGPNGPWESPPLQGHYGYIKKTEGADGEHLDVYIAPGPPRRRVYIVDQIDPLTGLFNEHKAMLNYPNQAVAVSAYQNVFSDGSGASRIGAVTEMPMDKFKDWIKNGDTSKPIAYIQPKPLIAPKAVATAQNAQKQPEKPGLPEINGKNTVIEPQKAAEPPKTTVEPQNPAAKSPFTQPRDLAEAAKVAPEKLAGLYVQPIIAMAKEKGIPITPKAAQQAADILAKAHQVKASVSEGVSSRPLKPISESEPPGVQQRLSKSQDSALVTPEGLFTARITSPSTENTLPKRSLTKDIKPSYHKTADLEKIKAELPAMQKDLQTYLEFIAKSVEGIHFEKVNLKGEKSVADKLARVTPDRVTDFVRGRLVGDTRAAIEKAVALMRETGEVSQESDFYDKPRPFGYGAFHIQVMGSNGISAEVQLQTPEMRKAQHATHDVYKKWQGREPRSLAEENQRQKDYEKSRTLFDEARRSHAARTAKKPSDNGQMVIPGAEAISDRQLAEKRMSASSKAKVPQKPADEGLFDVAGRGQADLLDKPPQKKTVPGKPKDALRFLASKGGIRDSGGELAAMDAQKKFIPGLGQLVRPRGMALDDAGKALHDVGYFGPVATTERPDINQVLELIRSELNGNPSFVETDRSEIEARTKKRSYADDLERHADRLGIDVSGMNVADIEKAVRAQEAIETAKADFLDSLEAAAMRDHYAGDKDLQPAYEESHVEETETPAASPPQAQNDTREQRPAPVPERASESKGRGESRRERPFAEPDDEIPFQRSPLIVAREPLRLAPQPQKVAVGMLGTRPSKPTLEQQAMVALVKREVHKLAPGATPQAFTKLQEDYGTETSELLAIHGAYYRTFDKNGISHIIAWSLESENPLDTVRHEVIHYLRKTALITGGEWKVLEKTATQRDWLDKHQIKERYPDFSAETQMEEAVAEEYPDWQNKVDKKFGKLPGAVQRTFRKMDLFRRRVAAGLRDVVGKEPTAEDIFTKIETGEIGIRQPIAEALAQDEAPVFQRAKPPDKAQPVFYSALTRAVESIPQEKASAEQWRGIVKNLKGVKEEERAWSGIDDWLAAQRGPLEKPKIIDYLRANEVQIEEVLKTDQRKNDAYISERDDGSYAIVDDDGNEIETFSELEYAEHALADYETPEAGTATKYHGYQLPGGKNYRELLLTLPPKEEPIDFMKYDVQKDSFGDWQVLKNGRYLGNPISTTHADEAIKIAVKRERSEKPQDFRSSHFSEPNVLAHVRFNDRTGPSGEKILHIEEIQSDWHQKGRKHGYKLSADEAAKLEARRRELEDIGMKTKGGSDAIDPKVKQEWVDIMNRLQPDNPSRVPDAPFKTTWPELSFKRMVRYAAEHGYDKISWTTGEIQAERYDLSKHIDRISYSPNKDGTYELVAEKDGHPLIAEDSASLSKIEDLVGKEIAEKIKNGVGDELTSLKVMKDGLHGYVVQGKTGRVHHNVQKKTLEEAKQYIAEQNARWKQFTGLNLKMGGEGMKWFYDKILPSIATKLGKKFGAIVGPTGIDATLKSSWQDVPENKAIVHSLDITPQMRESVMQGQPLFQRAKKPKEPESKAPRQGSIFKKPLDAVENAVKDLVEGTWAERLADGYTKVFSPQDISAKALRGDAYLAQNKVKLQHARDAITKQGKKDFERWDKAPVEEQKDWIKDHETGDYPASDEYHAAFKASMDATWKMEKEIMGADPTNGYRANYFSHLFEKPDEVAKYFAAQIKRYGSDWFTKKRSFELAEEAEAAGFKLRTTNPEEMRQFRLMAGQDMIQTFNLLKNLEAHGLAAKVSGLAKERNAPTEGIFNDLKLPKEMIADLMAHNFRIRGPDNKTWIIHSDLQPLWENAMEQRGLWSDKSFKGDVFRFWQAVRNTYIPLKLGLSLFHPAHVATIHMATAMAAAAENSLKGGKMKDTVKSLSMMLTMGLGLKDGINPFRAGGTRDHPYIVALKTLPEKRTAEQQMIVNRFEEGGFTPLMSERDVINFRRRLLTAFNQKKFHNLPIPILQAVLRGLSSPFFEHWIPGLKAEAYMVRTQNALNRDPALYGNTGGSGGGKPPDGPEAPLLPPNEDDGRRAELFRQIAKDLERTYGEMNYDTLFWNKTVRDAFTASFLSAGWKLAQLYYYKGMLNVPRLAYKAIKGEFNAGQISYNTMFSLIYGMLSLTAGAMLSYWAIGKVRDFTDMVFPPSGDKRPDDTDIRLSLPFFNKEWASLGYHTDVDGLLGGGAAFVGGQTLYPEAWHLLNNEDYVGRPLVSDLTSVEQVSHAALETIKPISFSQNDKADLNGSKVAKFAALFGAGMAPMYAGQTKFQNKVAADYFRLNPTKGSAYQRDIINDYKTGLTLDDEKRTDKAREKLLDTGMTPREIQGLARQHTTPFTEFAWRGAGKTHPFSWQGLPAEEQIRLFNSANAQEKEEYYPMMKPEAQARVDYQLP